MTICILGRQPEIGLAELEALYGSKNVRLLGDQAALVDADVEFSRLGGSVKAGQLLETLHDISRKGVFTSVAKLLPRIVADLPSEGKIKLGLSVYGLSMSPYELGGEALRLKKNLKNLGRSVRVVPNEELALSSAQTYHNRLADELGIELLIIRNGDQTHIGRVTSVQDIDSYRIRDRERPKRDAFVGMLPPKLAQIIINLAVGTHRPESTFQLLDPFCGTGVILQEAMLMGYSVIGSDVSPRMGDYTTANLDWLWSRFPQTEAVSRSWQLADATSHTWMQSKLIKKNGRPSDAKLVPAHIDAVATETFLGQPLGGQQPSKEKFAEIVHETNSVIRGFFENIAPQLPEGTQLCVAVPVWFYEGITHLPVIDELSTLGLTRHAFTHATEPLMYHRDDQMTGRELLVLRKTA